MSAVVYVAICGKRAYIGSSHSWEKRFAAHIGQLKAGCHHNKYLQNVYSKYGAEAVSWRILVRFPDTILEDDLRAHEQNIANVFSRKYTLMNIATIGRSPTKGRKMSQDTRDKCSAARRKEWAEGRRTTPAKVLTAEFAEKMTAINRQRAATPEFLQHLREQAASQALPERRKARREFALAQWADPEFKAKMMPKFRRGAANNKSRAVTNLDTGVTFVTVSEAAATIQRSPSSLVEAIERKGLCGGYRWSYDPTTTYAVVDTTPRGSNHHCATGVRCVETQMLFGSIVEAVAWLRENGFPKAVGVGISNCVRKKPRHNSAYGFTWESVGQQARVAKGRRLSVVCIETGAIYDSLDAVCEHIRLSIAPKNPSKASIANACNLGKKCYGYHWRYATEEEKLANNS